MTDLQKRVAEGYVTYNNISKAAQFAGIQGDNARISAWQMLQHDDVQEYIEQLRKDQSSRTLVTMDKVQAEIARLAFSDIRDYYREDGTLKNPHELSDDAAAALAGIEIEEMFDGKGNKIGDTTKIKPYDKLNALDKLARRLGMFEKDNDQRNVIIKLMQIDPLNDLHDDTPDKNV